MTETNDVVLFEVSERIATITLNRPEARNALSSDVLRLLPQRMREAKMAQWLVETERRAQLELKQNLEADAARARLVQLKAVREQVRRAQANKKFVDEQEQRREQHQMWERVKAEPRKKKTAKVTPRHVPMPRHMAEDLIKRMDEEE